MSESIVIVGAARTPMGSFQGDFASLAAHDLGGAAIRAAVARAGIAPEVVNEVLFGNCLMAGQGQAPARQAAFKGGLPKSAGAVTLSTWGAEPKYTVATFVSTGPRPSTSMRPLVIDKTGRLSGINGRITSANQSTPKLLTPQMTRSAPAIACWTCSI